MSKTYEYEVEMELPCFVTVKVTADRPLDDYELGEIVPDAVSDIEYGDNTAGVEVDEEADDVQLELESVKIESDWAKITNIN